MLFRRMSGTEKIILNQVKKYLYLVSVKIGLDGEHWWRGESALPHSNRNSKSKRALK